MTKKIFRAALFITKTIFQKSGWGGGGGGGGGEHMPPGSNGTV